MPVLLESVEADSPALWALAEEARAEGYEHIDRMVERWRADLNRFDKAGELLLAARRGSEVVGVGGLSIDPYLSDPEIGRIRHVYVRKHARRIGVGQALLKKLLSAANGSFKTVRVRAAARGGAPEFYDAVGFTRINAEDASHIWRCAAVDAGRR